MIPSFLRNFIFLFVLLGHSATASGQSDHPRYLVDLKDAMHADIKKISSIRKNQREHQLYLNNSYQHSILTTNDNRVIHFNGRYSVLDNAIQWTYKGEIGNIYTPRVKSVLIGETLMRPFKMGDVEDAKTNVFLEVLAAGELNLYIHHFLDSKMAGSNSITSSLNGTKEYFLAERLQYSVGDGPVQNLKSKKKNIRPLFEERIDEMESFISEHDLKYNDMKDLIAIFNHFNQLQPVSVEDTSN